MMGPTPEWQHLSLRSFHFITSTQYTAFFNQTKALGLSLFVCGFALFANAKYGKQSKVRFPPIGTSYYPKGATRQWKLRTQSEVCIHFNLSSINMEKSNGCSMDYLDVYDGLTNSSFKLLHTCGEPVPLPKPFTSSSNSLLVVFISNDNNMTGKGFQASITTVECAPTAEFPPSLPSLSIVRATFSLPKCGSPPIAPLETGLHARLKREAPNYHEYNIEEYSQSDYDSDEEMSRIVGGVGTIPHSWPWQVSIRYGGLQKCGGALVSPRTIISAAHCFRRTTTDPESFEFWVGKHSKDDREPRSEQQLYAERIIIYPNYNKPTLISKSGRHDNDIAVIKLAAPGALFTKYVHPICLPPSPFFQPSNNSVCYVTGFGMTKGTGDRRRLKQAAVPIISNERCKQMERRLRPLLTERMMCAGYTEGGHDSCQGDSGGPLACKIGPDDTWVLSGVVSFGYGCAGKSSPGVYVRVNKFLSWLRVMITDLPL